MRRTKKPCPSCNVVHSYRKADDICHECRGLIEEAKAERLRRHRDQVTELVRLPWAAHSFPHIFHSRRGDVSAGQRIQESIFKLASEVLGIPSPHEHDSTLPKLVEGQDGNIYDGRDVYRLPAGERAVIGELYKGVLELSETAYAEGYRDGQRLITQLAKGEVSIDKFNKLSIGEDA